MLLDFEIQRCTRRCAATDRALEPGEICYSVLESRGADIIRKDYSKSAWSGPPAEAFGWWKSRIPELSAKRIKLAPNDVLVELFEQLAERPTATTCATCWRCCWCDGVCFVWNRRLCNSENNCRPPT